MFCTCLGFKLGNSELLDKAAKIRFRRMGQYLGFYPAAMFHTKRIGHVWCILAAVCASHATAARCLLFFPVHTRFSYCSYPAIGPQEGLRSAELLRCVKQMRVIHWLLRRTASSSLRADQRTEGRGGEVSSSARRLPHLPHLFQFALCQRY
jgi:hypothetical protein